MNLPNPMNEPSSKPILQRIRDEVFDESELRVYVLRLDIIHPGISGNKWYKLKYNLKQASAKGFDTILTFGGAFSNHIHAASIAAFENEIRSIGIIRGERIEPLNPTLQDAQDFGMELHFISRTEYRQKNDEQFLNGLKEKFGSFYLVPEGGTNSNAIKGASKILDEIDIEFDHIITAVGTGGTVSGIICGLDGESNVLGIPVLKGGFLKNVVEPLVSNYSGKSYSNWEMDDSYHFGGYAKYNSELVDFINDVKNMHDIPLDPVYTGKMFYALYDLSRNGYFQKGSNIVAVHTGGLQGIRGFNNRFGNLINL
jgi:1-aminocyclopropane-1-carboxylate deaminase/D-cysteine desulfhydrase-like pyridoxal-dependent ACC family enzyme